MALLQPLIRAPADEGLEQSPMALLQPLIRALLQPLIRRTNSAKLSLIQDIKQHSHNPRSPIRTRTRTCVMSSASAPRHPMDRSENVGWDGKSWDQVWKEGIEVGERFDKGETLPELVHQLRSGAFPRASRALVPGCGRGYDVVALCESGLYNEVVGLDESETAVAAANAYLATQNVSRTGAVVTGDFFDAAVLTAPFDLIFDCSFLCAIPLSWRPSWAARMKDLVRVGGVLVTMMYPMGKPRADGGPPHGVSDEDYRELLEGPGGFVAKDGPRVLPEGKSHAGRGGRTSWCVWERVSG